MPAPPQIVGVPGSMNPLEERMAVAYSMGARTPEEMAKVRIAEALANRQAE